MAYQWATEVSPRAPEAAPISRLLARLYLNQDYSSLFYKLFYLFAVPSYFILFGRDSVQKPSSCTKNARGMAHLSRGHCGHQGQVQGGRARAALDTAPQQSSQDGRTESFLRKFPLPLAPVTIGCPCCVSLCHSAVSLACGTALPFNYKQHQVLISS